MTSAKKPGSARLRPARLTGIIAAIGIPLVGLGMASGAWADQPASFVGSSVPIAAAVAPSALVASSSLTPTIDEPSYRTIGSGKASYYGRELAGNRTASGERFNPSDLTAAHRTLPLGSKVRITNARTGDSVIVRINDRGPFHSNRVIDLSEAAARQVGIRAAGSGMVELAVVSD